MELKQALPVIDSDLARVQFPESVAEKYLFNEFDHVDYQAVIGGDQPQQDLIRLFKQSAYLKKCIQKYPLASLSLSDISTTDCDSSAVYFFGANQVELAYATEQVQLRSKYYKSSTPLLAVAQYLKRFNKDETLFTHVKDPGFCVRSNPKFLYLIAKMCYQKGAFIDLAS